MVVVPSAARAARISDAPARRSPISTSAPTSRAGPWIVAWCASGISTVAPIRRTSLSHSRRSSKIASWTCDTPVAWESSTDVGGWRSVARPGYGAVSMSVALYVPAPRPEPSTSMVSAPQPIPTPTRSAAEMNAARWSHEAPSSVICPPVTAAAVMNVPASMRSGMTRCSAPRRRLRPSISMVSGKVRSTAAPIAWRNAIRSSTSGSWAAGRMTLVPSAGVAARVADDDPPEACQQRPEEHEAGAHPGSRLERDEEPLDVARGDLVDVVGRVIDDDTEVAQCLGHDPHVFDLGDVREPTALTGQRCRREQLERCILGPTDRHDPRQRLTPDDPEDLARDRLRPVLPVKRSCFSHARP